MGMRQIDLRDRLLADMQSGDDAAIVAAVQELLTLGEYGEPSGTYLLTGGRAALRLGHLADAVVLLYHGLRVAAPGSLTWAELLVNRAVACSRHGFYQDAINAGEQFLAAIDALPSKARDWIPHSRHAMGLAHDRLHQYDKAVPHHRVAAETYPDPTRRTHSLCDLAYSLALSGDSTGADHVLSSVEVFDAPVTQFVYYSTTTVVLWHQGRHGDAVAAGARAEALAADNEGAWALPLAELRYWLSRAVWDMGDRHRAAALALCAAVVAHEHWHFALQDAANAWLTEIMAKGGIGNA
jgi:tetratricopeptide (TPR) repeat protein